MDCDEKRKEEKKRKEKRKMQQNEMTVENAEDTVDP